MADSTVLRPLYRVGDRVRVKVSVVDPGWLKANNRVFVAIVDEDGWIYVRRSPDSETVHGPFVPAEVYSGWGRR